MGSTCDSKRGVRLNKSEFRFWIKTCIESQSIMMMKMNKKTTKLRNLSDNFQTNFDRILEENGLDVWSITLNVAGAVIACSLIILFIIIGSNAMGVKQDGESATILSSLIALVSGAAGSGGEGEDTEAAQGNTGAQRKILIEISAMNKKLILGIVDDFVVLLKDMPDVTKILVEHVNNLLQEAREQDISMPEFMTKIPDILSGKIESEDDPLTDTQIVITRDNEAGELQMTIPLLTNEA